MFSLDTNVLRHGVMVAPDTLTVVVEVRILLSQQILTLKLTKIVLVMKTIEERASLAAWQIYEETILSEHSVDRVAEIIAEKIHEQKAIDDAILLKLDSLWEENDARHNHEDEMHYKQGYHDAIDKACEWLKENARDYACATIRCPYGEEEEIICDVHQEIVEDFRKAMEE